MEHVMFMQQLKVDKIEEYKKTHREVWPLLLIAHRDAGIIREKIWIENNKIYIYIMAEDFDKAMGKLSATQIFKDWIKKMSGLMDVIQDYSGEGNIKRLDMIFDLEGQLESVDSGKGK
jgi:L-rhamnose mutarotase